MSETSGDPNNTQPPVQEIDPTAIEQISLADPSQSSDDRGSSNGGSDLDVGSVDPAVEEGMEEREPLDVDLHPTDENSDVVASPDSLLPSTSDHPSSSPSAPLSSQPTSSPAPIFDDPSDDDDGEGEWITPSNVTVHKSRALGLTPSGSGKGKAKEKILVGCMTADFAMQNVLLQMSLDLVGVEGKKIEKVKTWVLRCHACFK